MGKNYNEISNQIAVVQTSNKTCAFYGNLNPVSLERFAEIITGKIKILINDFSNGKGDNASFVYYNLELKDIYYLYNRAKMFFMPTPFYGSKIHGGRTITEGPDTGKVKAFRITIRRDELDKQGTQKNNPWNITIQNGVAIAKEGRVQGSYYEAPKSFEIRATAYINLSDADFINIMESVYTYIDKYKNMVSSTLLPQGLKKLEEINNRNTYQEYTEFSEFQPESTMEYPSMSYQVQPEKPMENGFNPEITPVQMPAAVSYAEEISTYTQVNAPEMHPVTILIQSDFQALEGGHAIAKCISKGKEYMIYFDGISNELIEAQKKQIPVHVYLYMDNQKNLHCTGTVA